MPSAHCLQPRQMLWLLHSMLWSFLEPDFILVSAETDKLEMKNSILLVFWLEAGVGHHRRCVFCTDPQGCRNSVEVDLSPKDVSTINPLHAYQALLVDSTCSVKGLNQHTLTSMYFDNENQDPTGLLGWPVPTIAQVFLPDENFSSLLELKSFTSMPYMLQSPSDAVTH